MLPSSVRCFPGPKTLYLLRKNSLDSCFNFSRWNSYLKHPCLWTTKAKQQFCSNFRQPPPRFSSGDVLIKCFWEYKSLHRQHHGNEEGSWQHTHETLLQGVYRYTLLQIPSCRTGQDSSSASISEVIPLEDTFVSSRLDKDEDATWSMITHANPSTSTIFKIPNTGVLVVA